MGRGLVYCPNSASLVVMVDSDPPVSAGPSTPRVTAATGPVPDGPATPIEIVSGQPMLPGAAVNCLG